MKKTVPLTPEEHYEWVAIHVLKDMLEKQLSKRLGIEPTTPLTINHDSGEVSWEEPDDR